MENKLFSNLSRRTFLKGTIATGATVALAGCSSDDSEALVLQGTTGNATSPTIYPEQTFKGACRPNCPGGCFLDLTVRNNKIVKTKRAKLGENETGLPGLNEEGYYDRMCLRGASHVQRMYSPERILYPLKRNPNSVRGDRNAFHRITWAQAIEEIAQKMVDITAQDSRAFSIISGSSTYGVVTGGGPLGTLANSLGLTSIGLGYDTALAVGTERVFGPDRFPFVSSNDPAGSAYANTIVFWAFNYTETSIQGWHYIADAVDERKRKMLKASGKAPANLKDSATIITVDPMFTIAASKSDYHVAPRIGSDIALALGILREIMYNHANEGWVDWQYLFECSVAPFLVNPATGAFLRKSDITGVAGEMGYVMWNKTTSSYEYTTNPVQSLKWENNKQTVAINTALTATDVEMENNVSVLLNDGTTIQAKSSYLLLKEHVNEWTLEKTSQYTSLKTTVIEKMADLMGNPVNYPVTVAPGFGTDHYVNGHHAAHAISTIACITGNYGKPGASTGVFSPFGVALKSVPRKISKSVTSIPYMLLSNVMETNKWDGKDYPEIKGLWVSGGNPVSNFTDPKSNFIDKIISKLDFMVTSDFAMTDTAAYSDIVLPACYWFESVDLLAKSGHPYVLYNEKAVEPMGSSVSDWEMIKRVANAIDAKTNNGISVNFTYTEEEYLEKSIGTVETDNPINSANRSMLDPSVEYTPLTWNNIREKKAIKFIMNSTGGAYIHREDKIYRGNRSLRAEFYSESPFILGAPVDMRLEMLPSWYKPNEAWDGEGANAELVAKFPLAYTTENSRWRVHAQWFNIPWLNELEGEPKVYINPANTNGIVTGDTVKVSNDRGYVVIKAHVTDKVGVGQINIQKGLQSYQFIEGNCQNMTSSVYHPVGGAQAFFDVLVKVEKV